MHPPEIGVRQWRLILHLGPIDEEVSQSLGFDGIPPLILWCIRCQLNGPLGYPATRILVADNFRDRSCTYHRHNRDDIWCLYGGQETQALLPRAPYDGGVCSSYLGDYWQQRCKWPNSQVGH